MAEEKNAAQAPRRADRKLKGLAEALPDTRRLTSTVSNTSSETARLFSRGRASVRPNADPDLVWAEDAFPARRQSPPGE